MIVLMVIGENAQVVKKKLSSEEKIIIRVMRVH